MAYRFIVPKLTLGMDAIFCKKHPHDYTVKELQTIIRNHKRVPRGNKDDLIKQLSGFFQVRGRLWSKFPGASPGWFFYDEVAGFGDHTPHFLCACGKVVNLPDSGFSIRADGYVNPSLNCIECEFHPWAHLADFPLDFSWWTLGGRMWLDPPINLEADPSLTTENMLKVGAWRERPDGARREDYIAKYYETIGKDRGYDAEGA